MVGVKMEPLLPCMLSLVCPCVPQLQVLRSQVEAACGDLLVAGLG